MNLAALTKDMPELIEITSSPETEIGKLVADSRAACRDGLFFCIRGGTVDAHDFAPQALKNGCVALVVERRLALDCPQVVVTDVRAAMTRIASAFHGHPEREMKLVGVTGTKGKTTTTFLLKSIIEAAGMSCGIIGTTGCIAGETKLPSHLTTPDPIEMFEILRIMADAGVQVVCMEVSAHALYLRKLVCVSFEAAAYTNLSQDHLDFFGSMEKYFAAKQLLFTAGMARNATVNVDEETGGMPAADLRHQRLGGSVRPRYRDHGERRILYAESAQPACRTHSSAADRHVQRVQCDGCGGLRADSRRVA